MNSPDFLAYLKAQTCIFWDWNGTLLDDLDYSLGISNHFFELKGFEGLSKESYQDVFTIPISDYYDNLKLKEKNIDPEEVTDHYLSRYEARRDTIPLFEGAFDCLEELRKEGVTQVLFSAAHISELEFQVKHHGISDFFEMLSGAGDFLGGSKLDRGRALQEEYSFSKGVMVGDTLHDVEIGKEIGFETVWVSEGHQSLKRASGQSFIDYIYDREENNFYRNN